MRKKSGLMSIGIALIMLIFSLIVAMVISNISSNLYKNIVKMGERKESQYKRVIIMSLKNNTDYINSLTQINGENRQDYFNGLTEASRIYSNDDFSFIVSEILSQSSALVIDFPATVTLSATAVTTENATLNFFELYTRPDLSGAGLPYNEDEYGIIVQYDSN